MLIRENKVEQSAALLRELGELNDAQKLDRALIEARISAAKMPMKSHKINYVHWI